MPLVVLEGIDGCGKTTQFNLLKEAFKNLIPKAALFVREPGSTKLGEGIRALLLDPEVDSVPLAEMLQFLAARAQLLEEVVKPALHKQKLVVMDRFFHSTIAYQICGLNLRPREHYVKFVSNLAYQSLNGVPDLTILFQLPIETSIQRRKDLNPDRMEQRGLEYYSKVQEGYQTAKHWCEKQGHKISEIDATKPPEEIHKTIKQLISKIRINL